MPKNFATLLDEPFDDGTPHKKITRKKPRSSRGDLHDMLTRGLPDLCDFNAEPVVCNLHRLAKALGLTYQAVYKWFKPGRVPVLPMRQAVRIIALSEQQKRPGKGFVPLKFEDFKEFVGE